jgi:iron complex outermembrane receptor protein
MEQGILLPGTEPKLIAMHRTPKRKQYTAWICLCLLFCIGFADAGMAQQNKLSIKGILVNETGEMVPHATVLIANKDSSFSKQVKADERGIFSFYNLTPDYYHIRITSVGYATAGNNDIHYDGNNVLTFTFNLTPLSSKLNEVVVVGYGTDSRKNISSSITSVSSEDFNKGVYSDPLQMLQGKVAGLTITRSGDPNVKSSLLLRGPSTLRDGANEPLVVIDGVPGADISAIAPSDIASIDVLKDAAATAIYGNRGANGILMVTTKRAKKGQARIAYDGYVSMDKVSNRIEMLTGDQVYQFLANNNQSLSPKDDLHANTDWQKAIQRSTAISQNHNLSLSGGNNGTLYAASLNYFKQEGILKNSGVERVTGRVYLEQQAFDNKLKLGFNVINSVNNATTNPAQATMLSQSLRYLPTVPVYNPDGTYFENRDHSGYYNPVALQNNAFEKDLVNNLIGSFTAALKLPFGFSYNLSATYKSTATDTKQYLTSYLGVMGIGVLGGQATRTAYKDNSKIFENFLTYENKFGEHSIKALIGYSYQKDVTGDGFTASNSNFISDDLSYNYLGSGAPTPSYIYNWGPNSYREKYLISDYGRLNYNYADKYLLQASIRHDGSSVFGANYRWGYFPSASAAWRVINENFMNRQHIFSDLKLRVGYGITGNSNGIDALTPLLILGPFGTERAPSPAGPASGTGELQNANPNLRWEKTAMVNAGLDFALLKNRLSGTIEVYSKTTSDLVWNYTVPNLIVKTVTANVGKMRNTGIELTLNGAVIDNKDFSWNSSFNVSHNFNKVLSLTNDIFILDSINTAGATGAGQTNAYLQLLKPGLPIGQFFTFKYAGKTDNGITQFYDHNGKVVTDLTTLSNSIDYYRLGNAQPKVQLGWSNSFRYKNFDLSVFARATLGHKIYTQTKAELFRPSTVTTYNIPVSAFNESVKDVYDNFNSSRFLENGSYLRLDNATLGYTFKKPVKSLQSIRLYATVNNLFVITNYSGIDPEVSLSGLTPGIDVSSYYPKIRSFLFGVNVSL